MSKTAKPNPLLTTIAAIQRLPPEQQAVVNMLARQEGNVSAVMAQVRKMEDVERMVLMSILGDTYKDDGTLRLRPGRKARPKQAPDGSGGVQR